MEDSPGEIQTYLYETLGPLCLPAATDAAETSPASPQKLDEVDPYSVLRNEISLSSLQSDTPAPDAIDYFSLDVGAELEQVAVAATLTVPTKEAELKTPVRGAENPSLESVWFRGNSKFKSPMLQLHKEIVDFCDFLSPTSEELALRNAAVESVSEVIKYIWPNCKVEVFGSFRTGLYLPTSDIDVVILGSGINTPRLGLQALSRALSQKGIAKNIMVIGKARVPIIKFTEKRSGVAFDISFDLQNGPVAAEYIKDVVSKWPPLRPLCLILKVFLQQRELNEVYSGGIGSYALLTMLMVLLRSVRESQPFPEHNLGVLLVRFFDFYGRKLNTSQVGVSCRTAGTFFLKSARGFSNKARPSLISIEDPQAPDNDIGKNSFNYFQIKSAFAMAFATLTNPRIIMSLGPNRSVLGTIIRPDSVLLERKGGRNGDVTFKSLLPGAGEPIVSSLINPPELFCNWNLDGDYEEEPLPRGGGLFTFPSDEPSSSGKKRKSASKERKSTKKKKANGGGEEAVQMATPEKKTPKRKKNGGGEEAAEMATPDKKTPKRKKKWKQQANGTIVGSSSRSRY